MNGFVDNVRMRYYADGRRVAIQDDNFNSDEDPDITDDAKEDNLGNDEDEDLDTQSEKRFGAKYGIGKVIMKAGPGGGYASYPWALDAYERDMGLRPVESWLLKRMIKHAWGFGDPVYISMRKTTRESSISSATLIKVVKSLRNKGFLFVVNRGEGIDRRVRYDVTRVYYALYYSIITDPIRKVKLRPGIDRFLQTNLPEEVTALIEEDFQPDERVTVGMVNQLINQKGFTLDWMTMEMINLPHPDIRPNPQELYSKHAIQIDEPSLKVNALHG